MKNVILVTGTPCVGKTTTAKQLATKLNAVYINLTEYTKTNNLTLGVDKRRQTTIINEKALKQQLVETINATNNANVIIDGHYAAAVVPKRYVTHIFVLRRNPIELRKLMEKTGFQGAKLWENLASEILDICLVEAVQEHDNSKLCELDVTGKTVKAVVNEILAILNENKKCRMDHVDWLGLLEAQGLIDDYLKVGAFT
jgi:adenylate kinase